MLHTQGRIDLCGPYPFQFPLALRGRSIDQVKNNKLSNSQQSKAKWAQQEIWMVETKKDALVAFGAFIQTWGVKYAKAVDCLTKDRDALFAFYDFSAEHWKASAHDERHRKLVRDDPSPHDTLQGMSLQQDRARHDLYGRCPGEWRFSEVCPFSATGVAVGIRAEGWCKHSLSPIVPTSSASFC